MAIQIAKIIGAYVATTGSGDNEEFLKELGADLVIDYKKQDFEKVLKAAHALSESHHAKGNPSMTVAPYSLARATAPSRSALVIPLFLLSNLT